MHGTYLGLMVCTFTNYLSNPRCRAAMPAKPLAIHSYTGCALSNLAGQAGCLGLLYIPLSLTLGVIA